MAGQRLELIPGTRRQRPTRWIVIVALPISSEEFRTVVFRVERDRQKLHVLRRIGLACQVFLHSGKKVRHPRTEIRIRATSENEREGQHLPPKLRQPNHPPQLIGQRVVRQQRSCLQQRHRRRDPHRRRRSHGIGVGAENLDTVDPAIIGGNQHAKTDPVTGFQPLEFLRLLYIEGHGHGRHETGNLLVLHHHRTPLRLHPPHHSADRILSGCFFNRRPTHRRSRGLWLAAKQTQSEGCGEECRRQPRKPLHTGEMLDHPRPQAKGEAHRASNSPHPSFNPSP